MVETQSAFQDHVRRGQDLKRKMETIEREIGGSDIDDDNDDKEEIQKKLKHLENALEAGPKEPTKGLFAMKFMKKAMEKQKREALHELKDIDDIEDDTCNEKKTGRRELKANTKNKINIIDKELSIGEVKAPHLIHN